MSFNNNNNNSSDAPLSQANLSAHDEATGGNVAPARRDSMPELLTNSNSSAPSASTDSSPEPQIPPPIEPRQTADEESEPGPSIAVGSRRARSGNDSGDADRDRRPPSQRTASGANSNRSNRPPSQRTQAQPSRGPTVHQTQPGQWHFQNTIPVTPGDLQGLFGGLMNAFGGNIQAQVIGGGPAAQFTHVTGGPNPDIQQWFTNLFAGLAPQPEHADPARARRMIRSLEPVPDGLVQRLQRLQEIGQADDGDSMCAVCWENLMSEGGGFNEEPNTANENGMDGIENTAAGTANSQGEEGDEETGELPRIVTLPCGHTFHSGCLIPWFSRPRGTTCPTCRLELDPNGDLTARPPRIQQTQGGATIAGPFGIPFRTNTNTNRGPPPNGPRRPSTTQTRQLPTGRPQNAPPSGSAAQRSRGPSSSTRPQSSQRTQSAAPQPSSNSSSSARRSSGPFNPAAVGLGNSNTNNGVFANPTGLFRGFFDTLTGANRTHEEAPPLEPITAPSTSANPARTNDPPSPSLMDIDVPSGNDPIPATFDPDMPWMPTRPPSREMQDELLREMARAYATRMAELVFDEQNGHHHHHHPIPDEVQVVDFALGGPPDSGGVDFLMDDQQGNVLGAMSFTFGPGPPPGVGTQNPPPTNPPPANTSHPVSTTTSRATPRTTSEPSSQLPNIGTPSGSANRTRAEPANVVHPTPEVAGGLESMLAGVFRSAGIPINADQINIATIGGMPTATNNTTGSQAPPQPQGQDGQGLPQQQNRPPRQRTRTEDQSERERRRREWVPPEPTGVTFRGKVEQRERAAGIRCWDASCGVGPSDEEPVPTSPPTTQQFRLRKKTVSSSSSSSKGKERDDSEPEYACEHSFHAGCLVSATRVALSVRGGAVEPDRDQETGDIHLHCPVCRVDGVIDASQWEDGAKALD